ncbi:MAG: Gfo/Idh/MocA family oxidoreductase [Ruminococcaceae bacterium]|nr:Gfo/Idh/MocA family oxidoreductase [Oscillospiraceae bacterium]
MTNICIVGLGSIAPVHISAVNNCKNAKLYGICDIDVSKKQTCEAEYGAKFYSDFDEMLKDENIDAVHICTPHYLHFEMTKKALKSGKKVVCEKPAVMTGEELDKLKNLERVNEVCFVVQNRLNKSVEKLKEIAESKKLGKIIGVKGILTWCRTKEYYTSSDWKGKFKTEGGGVLINQAVHVLDLMKYLVGDIKSVKANAMNYSLDEYIEVEDTFSAYLKFENGITGVFFATNANKANDDFHISITFENGTADYAFGKLFINGEEICENEEGAIGKKHWGSGHDMLIGNFYDGNTYFDFESIENTHKAMFSMYESAKNNGKEVYI